MRKTLLSVVFALGAMITNAQYREGYNNQFTVSGGIIVASDSVFTEPVFWGSDARNVTNDLINKWTDVWQSWHNNGSYFFNGTYSYLYDKPTLFSGVYSDLAGKPTIPTLTSQLTNDTGLITKASISATGGVSYNSTTGVISSTDYWNTANSTTGGVTVFYLTSDKTSTGTGLYTSVDFVAPLVNDPTQNYTYGWSYNSTTKALTVTTKTNLTAVISLLTVVLGPTAIPNGTSVQVTVKGH